MEQVVIKNVLDAVHSTLRMQNQHIDSSILEKADYEIIPYIERNFSYEEKEFKVIKHGIPKLANDKRIIPIVIRYYAICQNNVNLLEKLEESDYNFLNFNRTIKFYALDRQMTSKFKEKDYIRYLKKNDELLHQFYISLNGLDYHRREKIIKDFSEIIKRDHSTMNVGSREGEYNYLISRNIELFGKDFLINLSNYGRKILNSFYFQIKEEDVSKIKSLLEEYSNTNISTSLYKLGLDYFSVEELGNMCIKDVRLYEIALKKDLIDRMKSILSKKPEFDCPPNFIREEIFRVLDDDEIINLSEDAITKIASLKIPEVENVIVLPISKINRIVLLDKFKRVTREKVYKIN